MSVTAVLRVAADQYGCRSDDQYGCRSLDILRLIKLKAWFVERGFDLRQQVHPAIHFDLD
jgi:hypothetical protein